MNPKFRIYWRKEYLQKLYICQKWVFPSRNLEIRAIVIEQDDNILRSQWKLASFRGSDRIRWIYEQKMKIEECLELDNKGRHLYAVTTPIHKLVPLVENCNI